ncbi:hypothetical protein DMENIID0001_088250 [Sergentomyia squamirostris]
MRGYKIVDMLQAFGLLFAHIITIVETLLTRSDQLKFWIFLQKLEDLYGNDSGYIKSVYVDLKKSFFKKVWVLLGLSLVVELTLMISLCFALDTKHQYGRNTNVGNWGITIFAVKAGRGRHITQIMVVSILKVHIDIFNDHITMLKRNIKNPNIQENFQFNCT